MTESTSLAHVVIITGMSGAGRSQAANVLEDVGYFVVDNLPVDLISGLVRSVGVADGTRSKVAVVVDTRSGMDATTLDLALIDLHRDGITTTVLFLDADDRVLVQRFEESRRPHPVPRSALIESISIERETFEDVRAAADVIVDTSDLSVHQLRDRLIADARGDDGGDEVWVRNGKGLCHAALIAACWSLPPRRKPHMAGWSRSQTPAC